jgi:hypothetical protein
MLKGIRSTLADKYSANAYGIDLGVLKTMNDFNLGFSVQNMGTKLEFIDEGDMLPPTFRLGAGYIKQITKQAKLDVGFDISDIVQDDTRYALGAQVWFWNNVAFRAGYRFNSEDKISMGVSIRIKWVELDYSYVFTDVFNNTQIGGITLYFGK